MIRIRSALLTMLCATLLPLAAGDINLNPGNSRTLAATVLDQFGDPIPASQVTVTWTATGGDLSASTGASTIYTAGSVTGDFLISAGVTGTSLTASRTVTITAVPVHSRSIRVDVIEPWEWSITPAAPTVDEQPETVTFSELDIGTPHTLAIEPNNG